MITIHSETLATSRAATPEGTICSDQLTPPLPPSSKNIPISAAESQLFLVGRSLLCTRANG